VGGPPGAPLPVQRQSQTLDGTSDGASLATTLPTSGVLAIPPAPIAADAFALGHRLVVSGTGEPSTPPVAWYSGTWTWGSAQVVLRCNANCRSLTTSGRWFVDGNPTLAGNDSAIGPRTTTVVDSGFDLIWATHLDVLTSSIVGDASFVALSDGTHLGFPAAQAFSTGGAFFTPLVIAPLGLTCSLSTSSDTITCSPTGSFAAPAVSVVVPPAAPVPSLPAGFALALAGALAALGVRRLRN
jgi:hypothetical protein